MNKKTKSEIKLPSLVKAQSIYDVIGKGKSQDLDELLAMEPEFKCYLRPVIEGDHKGWGFVAENFSTSPTKAVYPMVYQLRQHLYDLEI